jgi:hypothetical protein
MTLALVLGLGGCGGMPMLGGGDREIPMEQIDQTIKTQLPKTARASYGTVKLLTVTLQPGSQPERMDILAKFILVSYEIPEGIEGVLSFDGTLRYDPKSRALYPADLQPQKLTFANPSLEEYISASARQGLPKTLAALLRTIPVERLPQGFAARKVSKASIVKEKLIVDFD